jgi:hypothetical protein
MQEETRMTNTKNVPVFLMIRFCRAFPGRSWEKDAEFPVALGQEKY